MKIVSVTIEPGRASQASADFTLRVALDGPAAGCTAAGSVTGPKCAGVSTVEVAYPLKRVAVSDTAVSLKCVIPEPSLSTPDAAFEYVWQVSVAIDGGQTDTRSGAVALRSA